MVFGCCARPIDLKDAEVIGDDSAASPDVPYRARFLRALREEYVQKKDGAVGDFLDSGVPADVQAIFDPLEDQVRCSKDPEMTLNKIAVKLGVRQRGGAPMPGGHPPKVIIEPPNPSDPPFMQTAAPGGTTWGQYVRTGSSFVDPRTGLTG
eukprot:TRINITY_DN6285_c0_g2_i4.p1 TRINITY_DN6285_c0_g2~~TRINITY_DN6285_c0_g2_i4.p1  ORF type:complete len:151 (-),score=22.23 TRINITY_DN6285_c0_g2_i4:151-603(-)